MKKYVKDYIGKGKQVENLDIVQVVLKMEDAEKHIFEMEGKRYLKFEVARLKEVDSYGRSHTCYVSELKEVVDEGNMTTLPQETAEKPKAKAKKGNKAPF